MRAGAGGGGGGGREPVGAAVVGRVTSGPPGEGRAGCGAGGGVSFLPRNRSPAAPFPVLILLFLQAYGLKSVE